MPRPGGSSKNSAAQKFQSQGWNLNMSGGSPHASGVDGWQQTRGNQRSVGDEAVSPGTVARNGDNYFVSRPPVPPKDGPGGPSFAARGTGAQHANPSQARGYNPAPMGDIAPWSDAADIAPFASGPPPPRQDIAPWESSGPPASRGEIAPWDTGPSADIAPWNSEPASFNPSSNGASPATLRSGNARKGTSDPQAGNGQSTPKSSKSGRFGSAFDSGSKASSGRTTPSAPTPSMQHRANSNLSSYESGTSTPPRTSDVAPWEFQGFQDSSFSQPAKGGPTSHGDASPYTKNHGHHRLHLPGQHRRSKEEHSKHNSPARYERNESPHGGISRSATEQPLQAPTSTPTQMQQPQQPHSHNLSTRSTSPLPGDHSSTDGNAGGGKEPKRKLFDKLRNRHKEKDKEKEKAPDQLRLLGGSQKSLTDPRDPANPRDREMSVATFDSGSTIRPTISHTSDASSMSQRKESTVGKLYHSAKPRRFLGREGSKEDGEKAGGSASGNYFGMDLDLSNMEGIVNPLQSVPSAGVLAEEPEWDAPDSWGVKRMGEDNISQLHDIHEDASVPEEEDTGVSHGLRVFRVDSTFATLSTLVNTTAAEILQILGKKSFLQDDLETYQIIMKKQDLQRQMRPSEKPVAIQKRLLEQAGYQKHDHIEEVGREDNSYLCKFTFVPMKLSGYYSLEKDPGLSRLSKFRDIDLSGRSLVAIPIVLYSRSAEIVTLNLSRNLALDVPKDFIQGCTHLRTIQFTGNEAWQLPRSFSLAIKLNYLDVSHNRLEQLDNANLENLTSLMSLKVSNNRLSALPPSFSHFMALRKLNVSSNSFKIFPDLLYELESLVDLDISFNHIQQIPRIGQLNSLERFVATNNQISGPLPQEFQQLVKLKELDIRHNGITNMDVIARLPNLEQLFIGNNSISKFEGSFQNLRVLTAERNPITRFTIDAPTPTLALLDLSDAKIVSLDDAVFERIQNLTKLVLDKNQLRALPNQIGHLRRLNYLSISKNALISLPPNVGCLTELEILDAHECNIRNLPAELWCCANLKSLNLASNVLEAFPKLTPTLQPPMMSSPSMQDLASAANSIHGPGSPKIDEERTSEDYMGRRPSQVSTGLLSVASSPAHSTRKDSVASMAPTANRKPSVVSRTTTNDSMAPIARKDSNIKLGTTFAQSLKHLSLSDNRLNDEIFEMITLLTQLRTLNLSYNEIDDIPQNALRKWPNLQELYLSGNDLRSLPTEDLLRMENVPLRVLHLNNNKFQVLPAELGKMNRLTVLDVGSNSLKYNVTNWRYDWNWNSNQNLKYLNFSGNKRLEIKPNTNSIVPGSYHEMQDLTNFNRMHTMRVLGLMDVTLMIPSIPDQTADRRVRSTDTQIGGMNYGMADTLGRNEHLSIIDLMIGAFRGNDAETLVAMFDGQPLTTGGSKVAKFLAENFSTYLSEEMDRLKADEDSSDALRRTFLALNKDLATTASQALDEKERKPSQAVSHRGSTVTQTLTADDVRSGGVATVLFIDNMELYVANVGDAQAVLMKSDASYKILTEKHHPAQKNERERIREAGGYVSRFGKLNDTLEVSRAFGYVHLMPAVMAGPSVCRHTLTEVDELIVVASRELWEYVSPDVATDVARTERQDPMRAAEKLRDLAISFGATNKIMVMVLGVSDMKRREKIRNRHTITMGPGSIRDDDVRQKRRRNRHEPDDLKLKRLDQEVEAPQGDLSLVFTDIKSSTALWEYNPVAMQAGIKIHNDLLRRQLRVIGGYEVKTEGDAFMVAFPTAVSALLWCFTVQNLLLQAPWPNEIVDSPYGKEVLDVDQNVLYRGLSVRMGAHWGNPVCEPDPITRRMDYFGPMVNRASRISSVADGGQLTVSTDFITEIQRTLETYQEMDRNGSVGSDDTMMDDALSQSIRRDLRALISQGFEVKDLGERKLKGLENPEFIYLMYPHSLAARLTTQTVVADTEATQAAAQPAGLSADSKLSMEPQMVWDLWRLSLRLEMISSSLETPGNKKIRPPETAVMERIKNRGGEVSDQFVVQFLEHLIVRIESSVSALQLRHLVRPFDPAKCLLEHAVPMGTIMEELTRQLEELRDLKAEMGRGRAVNGR